ncbi:unnamed protein product [Adineta ricciae]|uniref:Uncharacterized protein n=1 Tax=Adineta ricciae TaxID=249248 RepID=A0A816F1I4_ADIRI|nr:unnamed protein product [Adineta ricciae]
MDSIETTESDDQSSTDNYQEMGQDNLQTSNLATRDEMCADPSEPNNEHSESGLSAKVKGNIILGNTHDYDSEPDTVFAELLDNCYSRETNISWHLTIEENVECIRRYTKLMDKLAYLQLQHDQWQHYHRIGVTKHIWTGQVSKQSADKFAINERFGHSKHVVEQTLNKLKKHIAKAKQACEQFGEEHLPKEGFTKDSGTQYTEFHDNVEEFVLEHQQLLTDEFQFKRDMLLLDAKEHELFQNFLKTNPTEEEMNSAAKIWSLTSLQLSYAKDNAKLQCCLVSSKFIPTFDLLDSTLKDIEDYMNFDPQDDAVNCMASEIFS